MRAGEATPEQKEQMKKQAQDEFDELAQTEPALMSVIRFAEFRYVDETTKLLMCVCALARMLRIAEGRAIIPLTTKPPKGNTKG